MFFALSRTEEGRAGGITAVNAIFRKNTKLRVFGFKNSAQRRGYMRNHCGNWDGFLATAKWEERFVAREELDEVSYASLAIRMAARGL